MKGFITYVKDSFNEVIHKVSWPKYSELQSSTILVLVASFIFAMLVYVIDYGWSQALQLIYEK